ncbi:MAG TPA: transglycosylase domain-containing protein [Solirubrobacteraceae bacterium]|jgi:penicillin-binding protein 1A|nr:transglycosylase domain-containing protein [Solirubrobacteraceae bacterium]
MERQRRRRRSGGAARVIIITLAVFAACMVIGVLSAVGYVVGLANSAPDLNSLRAQDPGRISTVYAADGQKLGIIQNDVLRIPIPSTSMPQNIRDATVAIEDQRFYSHEGVDFEGVVRAALKNTTSGKTVQGGSTLTMQLIRNIYVSGRQRTFQRKVREAKLAEELENRHPGRAGKEWILTKYLNSVPYGTNGGQTAVGIQAAARAFFDKRASELKLSEAALLAGLPQAPSAYNPFREPGRAKARRNDVLRKMEEVGYITDVEAARAIAAPLGLKSSGYFRQKRESYFFDYVTDELIKQYGVKKVRGGGLRIKTTIDLDLQKKARASIAKSLSFPGAPSAAIVSIDPANGYIRAMASSAKYKDSKFNLAADGKRQPGSAFKIMALVAAVNAGVNPASTYYPSGRFDRIVPGWGPIDVNCYGGRCSGGSKNLVSGTLSSDNTVYIRLALDIGPAKVKAAARGLGITSKLQGLPAETLGGLNRCCSPLEMANAYATIASGGWRNRPKAITEVRFPDGKVDDLSKPVRHKAFDSAAMYEVTKILEQNIKGGTGTRANIGCPAGGKTGTTDENRNAWFVGYTPKLSTSVWVGFPKANIPMTNLFQGGPVDGGTFPAQIWGDYMKSARRGFCKPFQKPGASFKSKPFRARYGGGGALRDGGSGSNGGGVPVQPVVPQPQPANPGAGTARPGTVQPPRATPQAPPTGGIDPDDYVAPPQPAAPPPEDVATPG